MKIPFIIYLHSLGIYLLLTLPTLVVPVIYFCSAAYAIASGFAALVVFTAIFLVLDGKRPPLRTVVRSLLAAVIVAVAVAFKLLLVVAMPERGFWVLDPDTLFPIVAVIAGWAGVAVNHRKTSEHFNPSFLEDFETIFTYDKNQTA